MDVSPEYVVMCEKAEEIQEQWRGLSADWYVYRYKNKKIAHTRLNPYVSGIKPKLGIWLPRQDQLQEMLKDEGYDDFSLVELFYNYVWGNGQPNEIGSTLDTMEKMWIGFVMKEKFKKIWNGKDWRNEKD